MIIDHVTMNSPVLGMMLSVIPKLTLHMAYHCTNFEVFSFEPFQRYFR